MQQALDIYIKLLIAIISFIAPLLINLLSVFSDGIAVKKRRLTEFEEQTARLVLDEINNEGADVAALITENSTIFKKRRDQSNKQLDLLDPKKQIIRIFPTFFYSLLLIMANGFISDIHVTEFIKTGWIIDGLLILTLVGSIFFAVWGVLILRHVVWAIIEVKQEIAADQALEKQQSKSEKISPINENSPTEKQ